MSNEFQIDPNNPVKEYTGVWIPASVMECEELSATEKICYGEIASFNECYASNAWLAKRLHKSEWTARQAVAHLEELGFVKILGSNGRFRKMIATTGKKGCGKINRVLKNQQSGCGKINSLTVEKSTPENKVKNKEKILNTTYSIDKSDGKELAVVINTEQKPNYGNEMVNEAFDMWHKIVGYPLKRSVANSRAAYNMMRSKEKGREWTEKTLRLLAQAQEDRYSGVKIANFADLQQRYEELFAWAMKRRRQSIGASQPIETIEAKGVRI